MGILKFFAAFICATFFINICHAQTTKLTDRVAVNGNCNSCKKKIEKSAMAAGAIAANWDKETKILELSYDPAVTNSAKIQTAVAAAGYDTQDVKATDQAYHSLDECCQYDRVALKATKPAKK